MFLPEQSPWSLLLSERENPAGACARLPGAPRQHRLKCRRLTAEPIYPKRLYLGLFHERYRSEIEARGSSPVFIGCLFCFV